MIRGLENIFVNIKSSLFYKGIGIICGEDGWDNPRETQESLLKKIIIRDESTVFGKQHGFSEINLNNVAESYLQKVPPRNYSDFNSAPIKRDIEEKSYLGLLKHQLIHNEITNSLFNDVMDRWYVTSGTSAFISGNATHPGDSRKIIPITKEYLKIGRKVLFEIYKNYIDINPSENKKALKGKMFTLVSLPEPEILYNMPAQYLSSGSVADTIDKPVFGGLITPTKKELQILDVKERYKRILELISKQNVTLAAAVPYLFNDFLEYGLERDYNLEKIFENTQVYVYSGQDPYYFIKPIREKIGREIDFIGSYGMSEGNLIAQQEAIGKGYKLSLSNNVVFFVKDSKIKINENGSVDLTDLESSDFNMVDDVQKNTDYGLFITNVSGLNNYFTKDSVRIVSLNPTRFDINGRYDNIGIERLTPVQIKLSLEELAKNRFEIIDFVYSSQRDKNRKVIAIELEKNFGSEELDEAELDTILQKNNMLYEMSRNMASKKTELKQLRLIPVKKDTFKKYNRYFIGTLKTTQPKREHELPFQEFKKLLSFSDLETSLLD